MAKKLEIEIEIDERTGEILIDAIGFVGKACEELHDQLADALGGIVIERTDKAEKKQRPVKQVSVTKAGI